LVECGPLTPITKKEKNPNFLQHMARAYEESSASKTLG
jgi:hypothetical protein